MVFLATRLTLKTAAIRSFQVLFFLLAALTAGSAIPSGLLMPQMVIGGLIGRMLDGGPGIFEELLLLFLLVR